MDNYSVFVVNLIHLSTPIYISSLQNTLENHLFLLKIDNNKNTFK